MATHFADLRAALETTLASIAGGLAIAWENVAFEPSNNQFLRGTLIPGQTDQIGLGANGADRSVGIFQVDVFLKAGDGAVSSIPDQIADAFKRGSDHSFGGLSVRVTSASIGAAQESQAGVGTGSPAWYVVPVSINYYVHTSAR